jgi:hypothetical protein
LPSVRRLLRSANVVLDRHHALDPLRDLGCVIDSRQLPAVPVNVATPLVVFTLMLRALISLSAIMSDFTLVVIHESSTYAPVFSPVLAQPAKAAIKIPASSKLPLNAFFIVFS